MIGLPNRRLLLNLGVITLASLLIFGIALPSSRLTLQELVMKKKPASGPAPVSPPGPPPPPPHPKYKPTPTYLPPPIKDNFPLLATSTPPPVPKWNQPRPDMHKDYNLTSAPPLFIGFTRTWPVLLQAVVSYITAGWPPSQIYVVENTGTQQANARGQLTLQNPFYLNHTVLHALGVNVVTTPALLSFAQLQNFFLSLTYAHSWPYYFWSHMDVLALSYEAGRDGVTPGYTEPGYKTIYELGLTALQRAREKEARGEGKWGIRFFAYDHLALVNPAAYEDVGGWDTLIPYYLTDCDMHSRLTMRGWSMEDALAGIVTDVASALADLAALYRVEGVGVEWVDPNPPAAPAEGEDGKGDEEKKQDAARKKEGKWWQWKAKRDVEERGMVPEERETELETAEAVEERQSTPVQVEARDEDPNLARWHALRQASDKMFRELADPSVPHGARD